MKTPSLDTAKKFFKDYLPQIEFTEPTMTTYSEGEIEINEDGDEVEDKIWGWDLEKYNLFLDMGLTRNRLLTIHPNDTGYCWLITMVNTRTSQWHSMYLNILTD